MKNKSIFVCLSVLVVLGLLLGISGCPSPAVPTTTAPTTTAPTTTTPTITTPTITTPTITTPTTTTPTEEAEVTLMFQSPWPPGILISQNEINWMDKVEQRTGGRVKFERIYGGTLSNLSNDPESIKDGVFDCGQISYVYSPGLYPLGTVTTLPFIEDATTVWAHAAHELIKTTPELQAEFAALNQHYLFTWAIEPMDFSSYYKITKLEDFQGLKVRVHGGAALVAAKLGWVGVSVPWEEIAVAAANHVVDVICASVPVTSRDAGLASIMPYYIPFKVYQFHFATVMNLDVWNSIPADLQAIITECSDEAVDDALAYLAGQIGQGLKDIAAAGMETVDWPASETERAKELAGAPVWADWVVEMNGMGLPGQKILDRFQELLAANR